MVRKIKSVISVLLISALFSYSYAQDCDISVRVVSQEESGLTKSAEDFLVKRIGQVSNNENFVVSAGSSLAIVPKLLCLTKDVVPGPPIKYSLNFELSLYLIDVKTGTIYHSEILPLKSVDNSESRAQISALSQLKATSPQLISLFKDGKKKVIAYYDANGASIIAEAKKLAAMREFEAALYTILTIPDCSKYSEEATT